MRLSIVTPVYNGASTLRHMVESVRRQTLADWELILVDDGSTDGSPALCDALAEQDKRIRVLHKPNGGVSSARNAGLALAYGEYIGFIDCDDSVKPEMYALLLETAERDHCDIVMGGYEKISDQNAEPISMPHDGVLEDVRIKEIIFSMAFWNGYLNGLPLTTLYGSVWPNLYRADIIRSKGIMFSEDVSIGEDLLFNLRYLSHARRAAMVNCPLYEYNITNISATRKQNKNLWDHYAKLSDCIGRQLTEIFPEDEELIYNLERQYLNYAINIAEEQICVFFKGHAVLRELKKLCEDTRLQQATAYVMRHGRSNREKLQAFMFRRSMTRAIRFWLKK
ncbi:MAG: glycosyltransferase [Eubacteriales bacterium]